MDYPQIAKSIISMVGGNGNITNVMSCMTRLRIEVADSSKIDKDGLSALEPVRGLTLAGSVVQIVLLKELDPVYEEVMKNVDIQQFSAKKKSAKDVIFNFIQGVFVPLVPILVVYGFMSAIVTVLETFHWIDTTSSTYTILSAMKNVPMYFFPILIAVTGSKYLKISTPVSVIVAGLLLYPDIIAFSGGEAAFVSFLGIPVKAVNYTSSVFPMVLCLFVIWFAEWLTAKFIPQSVKFLRAFFIFIISVPLCLWIAAPIGSYITMGFSAVISWLTTDIPVIGGIVIGALSSVLLIFGMHTAVIAILIVDMVSSGSSAMVPLLYYGAVVLAGMAFGAFLKSKDRSDKSYYMTSFLLGIFTGVAEPALYGIALRFKRCFLIMLIAGAVNGAATMLLGIRATAMGNGVFGFPGFAGCFIPFLIIYIVTLVGSAIATYLFGGVGKDEQGGVVLSLNVE